MKRTSLFLLMSACLFSAVAATHKVHFDSSRRKSGAKIAIRDINPSLPTDWTPYRYVGVEHAKIIMEEGLCLEEYLQRIGS